jgi:hypothetical protein
VEEKGKNVILRGGKKQLIYGALKEVITICEPHPAKGEGSQGGKPKERGKVQRV